MDFDDKGPDRPTLSAEEALPPADWTGIGHTSTVATLVEAHRDDLAKYIRRRAPHQDFGDLMQESIGRLAAKSSHALALIEKPGAYLLRIARNVLADRARSDDAKMQSHHHSFDENDIAGPDPHSALEARETLRRVECAIARLKPQTGSIFVMHRFDGLSYEEIAAAKGITVKGVEWHMAKAMVAIDRARAGHK